MISRILKIMIFFTVAAHSSLTAKVGADLTVWGLIDGNAFRNYEAIQDQVVQPSFTLYYFRPFNNVAFRLYYTGTGTAFKNFPQRRFLYQTGGMNGSYSSDESRFSFYWGAELDFRDNEPAYAYYEYHQNSTYFNMKADWHEMTATYGGLSTLSRKYKLLPQFDFREISGFLRQNIYLPTRTTVMGSVTLGRKRFVETVLSDKAVDEVADVTDPEDSRGGNGRGNGQGNGQGNGYGRGGTIAAIPVPTAEIESVYASMQGKSVTRMQLSLRLAQSLTEQTGLAVEVSQNRSLSGQGRYLSYQDGGYEENDLLFDDPYNYDFESIFLELTQILPFSVQLKTGWQGWDKRYYYPAFDMEGNPVYDENRSDQKQSVWIQLSRVFPKIYLFQSTRIFLSYAGFKNRSNDPFYTYSGYVAMFGWQIQI